MGFKDAIDEAQKIELDLVQVSPLGSKPVVCKLMDYGKHLFAKKKNVHPPSQRPKNHLLKK